MFIASPCKTLFFTIKEDDNKFKITCQHCNGFVTFSGRSGKLLYIIFQCAGISDQVLYPEELVLGNFYFKCPGRTKIQQMYQKFLKEDYGYQKYLRCPDLLDNNFEVRL